MSANARRTKPSKSTDSRNSTEGGNTYSRKEVDAMSLLAMIVSSVALTSSLVHAETTHDFVAVNDIMQPQNTPQAEVEPQPEQVVETEYCEPYTAFEEPYTSYEQTSTANYYEMPTDGLTQQGGVNYHDGRTETWYSSNSLYHYRTPDWTVDAEGFYRTDDGYYVVASSDYEQGTVIETSRGEAMVLDSGCDSGITDFYTNW